MSRGLVKVIIILGFLLLILFFDKESHTYKKHYECIITINVHEKFDFLLKQLENIKKHVLCDYAVILNCNDYIFHICRQVFLPENVYIHPRILNKKRNHGSLSEGIYNNMTFALDNFTFDYFIVSSSRNLFGNILRKEDLDRLVEIGKPHTEDEKTWEEKKESWHWPVIKNTLLARYCLEKKRDLYSSAHEGLVFTENGCKKIVYFLKNNPDIKMNLFSYDAPIEEFAFQTISMNMGEHFYYIGNGCCSNDPIGPNDEDSERPKFMYKTIRK